MAADHHDFVWELAPAQFAHDVEGFRVRLKVRVHGQLHANANAAILQALEALRVFDGDRGGRNLRLVRGVDGGAGVRRAQARGADGTHEHGDGGLRLTQRQNVILTGVGEPDGLLGEPLLERFSPSPDPFSRAVLACTSAPFCKFAILDVKTCGAELIEYLRRRVPQDRWRELDGLRLHLSGCKASCAQVQAAQVGLRATMGRDERGYRDAFDVALGGDVGAGRLARWAALEVPVDRVFRWLADALPAGLTGPEAAAGRLDAGSEEG